MTVREVEKPLLNAREAFERAELGGYAIETAYSYSALNMARQRLKSENPKRKYRIKTNKETGKYLIIRVA